MSKFQQYQRVRIVKARPDLRIPLKKCRDIEAWVVDFDDDGNPILEYNFQMLKHMAVFKDAELESYG